MEFRQVEALILDQRCILQGFRRLARLHDNRLDIASLGSRLDSIQTAEQLEALGVAPIPVEGGEVVSAVAGRALSPPPELQWLSIPASSSGTLVVWSSRRPGWAYLVSMFSVRSLLSGLHSL